eukprot:s428_g9.t3
MQQHPFVLGHACSINALNQHNYYCNSVSRAVLQSKINAVVGGLAQATHAQQARTVMEAWRSVSKEGKFQKEKSKMKQAQALSATF